MQFGLKEGVVEPTFLYRLYERQETGRVGEDGKSIIRDMLVSKQQSLQQLVQEFISVYKKYVLHAWLADWQKDQFNKCLKVSR